ncbi:DNA-directed RNA polymerase subunit A'' [Halovivax limisalsi]|uniref:DNA-directed RNA polymerase subunit A'' n=1 Tax=Halovivax limisalsi TaxID=1453760 RepID=UPI001FFD364B|nr:DNA-directed RNA polymerase subunit A'' [Halovivax limisalsi]
MTEAAELGLDDDIEAVVEDTDLPRRLKDRVYETLAERDDVTVEQADEVARAVENRYLDTRVDPLDPVGTVSAQSIGEPGTQLTMNTFHYAGVAEIDVTQGLPRLIELVDARKTPDTPMMTVHLEEEYATEREKAHEVVWKIEATKILALGDVSTNVADMRVVISLNADTLEERMITAEEVAEIIQDHLGVKTVQNGTTIEFGPEEPSYRDLLQLVEELRDITFKGIEEVSRVVIRREEMADAPSGADEEFVLYTEGSAFGDVLEIEGVDASRTTCNNIHEIYRNLGVEAAREIIIEETNNTLAEQGLDDVNVRHLMLVADIMTNEGTIESIGRHGISGSKDSVLARAAFEVTVNHLLNAAIHGEVDKLQGVTENVIVGKPIKLGTGDVDLRMGSTSSNRTAD